MDDDQHASAVRTAFFRFYEELNDFLPEECRRTTFPHRFTGHPSVKDTVEAIGIPHAEIDLILVDGRSVDFAHQLRGGERIAVYPVFESFDISPVTHLRPKPLRDTKFVVDVHLGKLARRLRLLGFDTAFRNDFADDEIVALSLREKRIILTRDRGILKHGAVTHGCWIRSNDPEEQVREVVGRFQLERSLRPFTRCSSCNGIVAPVDSADVRDRLPEDIRRRFDVVMRCDGCGRLYWKGSHYDRIREWVDALGEGDGPSPAPGEAA